MVGPVLRSLRELVRKAFTRTVQIQTGRRKKLTRVEVPPSEKLVYGIWFAIAALVCLTILEATYILVLRSFSSEIFMGITFIVGTILGAFFGAKT